MCKMEGFAEENHKYNYLHHGRIQILRRKKWMKNAMCKMS